MHEVSKAINNLDPSKDAIDKKICGDTWVVGDDSRNPGTAVDGKCSSGGIAGSIGYTKLSDMFTGDTSGTTSSHKRSYPGDETEKMEKYTSGKISKDVSTNLNKDQKEVVSSAFAKAADGKICGKTDEIGILVLRKQMVSVSVVVMPILAASSS
ncbi:hypothetical protein [Anaplasma bovis]|uniref:hypothetical protein n=1 Tax=Anaplasma bovis TaxID=186733 RepID=UPI002FEE91F4